MSSVKKIAIVTGANKGIGYAIVRNLILRSSSPLLVYATARDVERGTQSVQDLLVEKPVATALQDKSSEIKFLQLDIGDSASIQKFKEQLQEELGEESISILINNAGIATKGSTFNSGVVKATLAVNYYGTKEVTEALLPLMKRDGTGRIVNLSSMVGTLSRLSNTSLVKQFSNDNLTFGQLDELMQKFVDDVAAGRHSTEGWPTNSYAVSKIGVTAMTRVFARENEDILINSCCPGWIRTDMAGPHATGSPDQGSQTPVHLALADLHGVSGEFWQNKNVSKW